MIEIWESCIQKIVIMINFNVMNNVNLQSRWCEKMISEVVLAYSMLPAVAILPDNNVYYLIRLSVCYLCQPVSEHYVLLQLMYWSCWLLMILYIEQTYNTHYIHYINTYIQGRRTRYGFGRTTFLSSVVGVAQFPSCARGASNQGRSQDFQRGVLFLRCVAPAKFFS